MRFILLLAAAATLSAADKPFVPLFDGKTLNGWELCNGKASYVVEKGVIVGTTAEGSPNSFLCTKKEYGDFVLEFETNTDPLLNSGVPGAVTLVQIRVLRVPHSNSTYRLPGSAKPANWLGTSWKGPLSQSSP